MTVLNSPPYSGSATLIVSLPVSAVASDIQQTLFSQDDQGYIRTRNAGVWSSWGLINNSGGGGSGATSLDFTSPNGSLNGNATYNPGTQALSFEAELTNATPEIVYIDPTGNDLTADGSIGAPYASPDSASATIIDASQSKPYVIMGTGEFTNVSYSPKPFVTLDLQGGRYTVSNVINLDPSWSGASGPLTIKNVSELVLSGGMDLDFDAVGAVNAIVKLQDCNLTDVSGVTVRVNSSLSGLTVLLLSNFFSFSADNDFNIINCLGALSNGAAKNVSISHTNGGSGGNFNINSFTILSNLAVSSSADSGFYSFQQNNLTMLGQATYSISSDGSMIVNSRGTAYSPITPPIFDKGAGAGIIQFEPDFINVLPDLQNGAAFAPFVLSDNVKANYTPNNYIPDPVSPMTSDEAVNAHLQGIDNTLEKFFSYAATVNTQWLATDERIIASFSSVTNYLLAGSSVFSMDYYSSGTLEGTLTFIASLSTTGGTFTLINGTTFDINTFNFNLYEDAVSKCYILTAIPASSIAWNSTDFVLASFNAGNAQSFNNPGTQYIGTLFSAYPNPTAARAVMMNSLPTGSPVTSGNVDSATTLAAGASATVTLTWQTPFADASYNITGFACASPEDQNLNAIQKYGTRTATGVDVIVTNNGPDPISGFTISALAQISL